MRERGRDILLLTEYFLKRHALQLNRKLILKKPETAEALLSYKWPGNIRQLENAIERAVHLAEGSELIPEDFGISFMSSLSDNDQKRQFVGSRTLAAIERDALEETLSRVSGNICKAAKILDVSRPTIYRKLQKYGLEKGGK